MSCYIQYYISRRRTRFLKIKRHFVAVGACAHFFHVSEEVLSLSLSLWVFTFVPHFTFEHIKTTLNALLFNECRILFSDVRWCCTTQRRTVRVTSSAHLARPSRAWHFREMGGIWLPENVDMLRASGYGTCSTIRKCRGRQQVHRSPSFHPTNMELIVWYVTRSLSVWNYITISHANICK